MVPRKRVARDEVEDDVEDTVEEEMLADDGAEEEYEEEAAPAPKKAAAPVKKVVIAAPAKKVVAAPAAPVKKIMSAPPPAPAKKVVTTAPSAPVKKAVMPPPSIAKKVAPPPATAKKIAPEPVEAEEEAVEEVVAPVKLKVHKVDAAIVSNIMVELLDTLANGQSFMLTKVDEGKWTVGPVDRKATLTAAGKLVGQEYWNEVCTPEYLEWDQEWGNLTFEEKKQRAKKAGVTWESHTDQRVELIRLTTAYRDHLGVKKYKPEYESRKSRDAIRG